MPKTPRAESAAVKGSPFLAPAFLGRYPGIRLVHVMAIWPRRDQTLVTAKMDLIDNKAICLNAVARL